jgi:short-subunit dehydrogenase
MRTGNAWRKLPARAEKIDVLVNNAAISFYADVLHDTLQGERASGNPSG